MPVRSTAVIRSIHRIADVMEDSTVGREEDATCNARAEPTIQPGPMRYVSAGHRVARAWVEQ
eukprot:126066-Rhodomonas_salina.1